MRRETGTITPWAIYLDEGRQANITQVIVQTLHGTREIRPLELTRRRIRGRATGLTHYIRGGKTKTRLPGYTTDIHRNALQVFTIVYGTTVRLL